jgi:hypothetical protein
MPIPLPLPLPQPPPPPHTPRPAASPTCTPPCAQLSLAPPWPHPRALRTCTAGAVCPSMPACPLSAARAATAPCGRARQPPSALGHRPSRCAPPILACAPASPAPPSSGYPSPAARRGRTWQEQQQQQQQQQQRRAMGSRSRSGSRTRSRSAVQAPASPWASASACDRGAPLPAPLRLAPPPRPQGEGAPRRPSCAWAAAGQPQWLPAAARCLPAASRSPAPGRSARRPRRRGQPQPLRLRRPPPLQPACRRRGRHPFLSSPAQAATPSCRCCRARPLPLSALPRPLPRRPPRAARHQRAHLSSPTPPRQAARQQPPSTRPRRAAWPRP